MNSEQITAFLQEHWYIASVLIGAVILFGAIRNWNWLCDPTGTRDAHPPVSSAVAVGIPRPGGVAEPVPVADCSN